MKSFLFSGTPLQEDSRSLALLFLRLFMGVIMLTHGWPKLMGFAEMSSGFPDPLHIGSFASLSLTVIAEVFCSILLIVGAFTRLAAGALIINMGVALFVIHGPVSETNNLAELPLFYLVVYIYLFLTGAGQYALDARHQCKSSTSCCSSETSGSSSKTSSGSSETSCCSNESSTGSNQSSTGSSETSCCSSESSCGNMGLADRIIRMVLAMVFTALYLWGIVSGILGILLLVLAIPFFFAAIFGQCPPYKLFGWNTRCKK